MCVTSCVSESEKVEFHVTGDSLSVVKVNDLYSTWQEGVPQQNVAAIALCFPTCLSSLISSLGAGIRNHYRIIQIALSLRIET